MRDLGDQSGVIGIGLLLPSQIFSPVNQQIRSRLVVEAGRELPELVWVFFVEEHGFQIQAIQ